MDALQISQIVIAIAVATSILLQARGTGLSSTFGGESTAYRSRRGLERTLFRLTIVLILLVVASIAAIAADQNPVGGDPAYGGTYVEGVAGVPQYLNPVIAATDVDQDVARLAFSGLTRYDQSGAIVPDLASAFHTESDGRIWTFDIREDATWQDGQPVTADDVVFTVKLLQDRGYVGPYSDAFRGVTVDKISTRTRSGPVLSG